MDCRGRQAVCGCGRDTHWIRIGTVRGRGLDTIMTRCGHGQFTDWTRAGTDRVCGRCADITRTLPSHRVATAWKLHRHSRTFARQLPGRFLAVAPTVARTFTSVARDVSRQLLRQCSAVARMIHRTFRGCCAGYYAGWCADIARLAALPSCKGMVSNQNDRLSYFRKPSEFLFD